MVYVWNFILNYFLLRIAKGFYAFFVFIVILMYMLWYFKLMPTKEIDNHLNALDDSTLIDIVAACLVVSTAFVLFIHSLH